MDITTNSTKPNDLTLTDVSAPTDQSCGCGGCGCGAASDTTDADTSASVDASGITQIFDVAGMTCGHCVSSVTEELSELPGVESVTVDLNVGGASAVTVRSTSALTTDAVRAAIEDAGYKLVTPTA